MNSVLLQSPSFYGEDGRYGSAFNDHHQQALVKPQYRTQQQPVHCQPRRRVHQRVRGSATTINQLHDIACADAADSITFEEEHLTSILLASYEEEYKRMGEC